jgi:hypothetical protein
LKAELKAELKGKIRNSNRKGETRPVENLINGRVTIDRLQRIEKWDW